MTRACWREGEARERTEDVCPATTHKKHKQQQAQQHTFGQRLEPVVRDEELDERREAREAAGQPRQGAALQAEAAQAREAANVGWQHTQRGVAHHVERLVCWRVCVCVFGGEGGWVRVCARAGE